MNKFKRFIKKYWITVWMLLSIIAFFTVHVAAEYIQDQNREKRVIANAGDAGKRFSSDRLISSSSITPYEVPFSTTGDDPLCHISFQIFNHSLSDTAKRYPEEIYYSITAKLTDNAGNLVTIYDDDAAEPENPFPSNSYGIKYGDNEYAYFTSINDEKTLATSYQHFDKNEENDNHLYYICLPRTMTTAQTSDKVYIELVATPYSDAARTNRITELDQLKARLSIVAQAATIDRGWSGSFQDGSQTDLDAFTFIFSGSGESKLVLSYRSDLFEVNKFFLAEHATAVDDKFTYENGVYYKNVTDSVTGERTWTKYTDAKWKTIIINANSEDVKTGDVVTSRGVNRYDIQLYMKDPDASKYMTATGIDWDKINTYIFYNANAPEVATEGN